MSIDSINPERCVYLTESIGREAYNRLFVTINDLKAKSGDPIYLIIDSLGGSTYYAERIFNLITSPRCDGSVCPFVALAPQLAASAAADLLILSQHAIVAQDAVIHCHGSRLGQDEITEESLANIDVALKESNRIHTARLGAMVTNRLSSLLSYINRDGEDLQTLALLPDYPDKEPNGNRFSNAKDYLVWVMPSLSNNGKKVVQKALDRFDQWLQPHLNGYTSHAADLARSVFDSLISTYDFSTSGNGLSEFGWDFVQQLSRHAGYGHYLDAIADDKNSEFLMMHYHLTDKEVNEFNKLDLDDDGCLDSLRSLTAERAKITRCIAMTLCDALHVDENRLTGIDTYFLGLTDEVQGIPELPRKTRPSILDQEPPENAQ